MSGATLRAALIFVVSAMSLLQFFSSYCRSLAIDKAVK
jgi:hypothetical protein